MRDLKTLIKYSTWQDWAFLVILASVVLVAYVVIQLATLELT